MAPGGEMFRYPQHFGENVLRHGSHEWLPYSKNEVRLKSSNKNLPVSGPALRRGERGSFVKVREFLAQRYPAAHSFVFLGEAGCGKSELAINLALALVKERQRDVHFFDLDMTKPLFRSRDQAGFLEEAGVFVHYEEQFMDAPTAAGGVSRLLRQEDVYTVLDVGGDYIGASAIGGYAPLLNQPGCAVFYVINPYRPWSMDIEHIDRVLGQTLGVSHVRLNRLHLVGNPNLGMDTAARDVRAGARRLEEMVGPYMPIDFYTAKEELAPELEGGLPGPVLPLRLYLGYEWNT